MFETSLEAKFKAIFKASKISYDEPGESGEQDCLFIKIEDSKNVISQPNAKAKVTGRAFMIAQNGKIPFGFFSKAINLADSALTKDLYFYDLETNVPRYQNLVMRGFSFVYFFNSQYDPEVGTITSIDLTVEEQ